MKKVGLFLLLSIITQTTFAAKILGHMAPAEGWQNTIYLTEVSSYKYFRSGSSDVVIDSYQLDKKNNFKFDNLKEHTIYKLSVKPEGQQTGLLIQDGKRDNYAFVITGNKESTVAINAELSKLYLSYSIISSNADLSKTNDNILNLRTMQMPIYRKMNSLDAEPLKTLQDPEKIAEYQLGLVREAKKTTENTNKLLLSFILKETNPNLLLIGSGLYQVEFASNKDNDLISAHLATINKDNQNMILNSVIDVLKKSRREIKSDFLFDRSYMLMEGKNFNFLSPHIPSKFILLDFWASWCSPCRKSIKTDLPYLSKKYTPQQLQIIGVVVKDKFQPAEKAIKADKNTYPQIYDQDKFLDQYFEIEGIPYFVLINQETQEVKAFQLLTELDEYLTQEL
ncbi:TlpA family protein disulfide reductase [Edaphocola aurantiacus]|uniref:TlpA family protein disulfide reductase n=1 Tax=Edaphocola aurantiacus TaxID=2601682 RepID=UPI001C97EFE6|nr:TlpA disulfide reductase family protein [Edaphocola aurantiacus]